MTTGARGLDARFLEDLQSGFLSPIRERVLADSTLCLEFRQNYVNLYYRGGNLLRLSQRPSGYAAEFDPQYWATDGGRATLPKSLATPDDVQAWLAALPLLKDTMDLFFGRHPKSEREVQQQIVRENNASGTARSTDYFFCDLE